jgi:hypothetical protein
MSVVAHACIHHDRCMHACMQNHGTPLSMMLGHLANLDGYEKPRAEERAKLLFTTLLQNGATLVLKSVGYVCVRVDIQSIRYIIKSAVC